MSVRWFRFYADAMRNPKVARLSDKQFRLWVQLLSVASEHDGQIPNVDDLKHILNRRLDHLLTGVKELLSAGLIDSLDDGYEPHNWNKFQYKSDTSNERVAKHRAKRNVTVTPPETETETETESEDNTDVLSSVISGDDNSGQPPSPALPKIQSSEIEQAVECWNMAATKTGWPAIRALNPDRSKKLTSRLKENGLDGWKDALRRAMRSEQLGRDPPGWFSFPWLIANTNNILKVLEGNYDKRFGTSGGNGIISHQSDTGPINPMAQAVLARQARRTGEQQRQPERDAGNWAGEREDTQVLL